MRALDHTRLLVVGSGAMGVATAARAREQGAEVVLTSRDAARARAAASSAGAGVRPLAVDPQDVAALHAALGELAPLDHVAVLVGSSGARASSITATPLDVAQRAFGRLWATYAVLQAAAVHVRPEGSVCVLSGSSGRRGVAGLGVWGALHGSLEALARAAALELAPVRVNVVSPGGIGIATDRQLTPHRGRPEDIADAVLALAANPAVTGAVLDVDGGERLGTFSA